MKLASLVTKLGVVGALALPLSAQDGKEVSHEDGSYAFGTQFGGQFKEGEVSIDDFVAGFRDQLSGKKTRIAESELESAFRAWQSGLQKKRKDAAAKEGEVNLAAAEAFLKENGAKEGVKTTASGLQYIVLKEGSGVSPTATDKVKAHYHGTLVDGTVFDSSKERGQPFETQVNRVVKGWIEGLQLMKPGASYRFFIHPDLAYGPRGQNKIPANSLLIFDLDLIEVISAPKKKPKIQAVTPPVAIPPLKKKDK